MGLYQRVEAVMLCIDAGGTIAALRDCESQYFRPSLKWDFVDLFQRLPDITASGSHNEIIGTTENDGPGIWRLGILICRRISRDDKLRSTQ